MAESPRRVDLRLRIPAGAPFRAVAVELAVRFAEYAGASKTAIDAVSRSVTAALPDGGDPRAGVELQLSAEDGGVTVMAKPSRD